MVDADDAEGQAVAALGQRDGDGGLAEGGVDVVDGDGVVRVGGVAGDVADDAEAAGGGGEGLGVDEGRDLGGEVDAVDEDVGLDDFLVGAGLGGGFGEVPLLSMGLVCTHDGTEDQLTYDDVLEAGTEAKVDGTTTATTKSTDDEDARVVAGLGLALLDGLLDVGNQKILVLIAGDARKRLVLAVSELPGPGAESQGGTSETGVL